jgi:hypothetical protein
MNRFVCIFVYIHVHIFTSFIYRLQTERMEHKESVHRNTTPAENIKLFEKLLKGNYIRFHFHFWGI